MLAAKAFYRKLIFVQMGRYEETPENFYYFKPSEASSRVQMRNNFYYEKTSNNPDSYRDHEIPIISMLFCTAAGLQKFFYKRVFISNNEPYLTKLSFFRPSNYGNKKEPNPSRIFRDRVSSPRQLNIIMNEVNNGLKKKSKTVITRFIPHTAGQAARPQSFFAKDAELLECFISMWKQFGNKSTN
jgi:hypothetical protein